jgi:hypothetical protein
VEGDVFVVGQELTATPDKSGATGAYQWMRSKTDVADGEYENITDATTNKYTLAAADVGKYIKVKFVASGSYKGTVTSDALGPVEEEPVEPQVIASLNVKARDGATNSDKIEVGDVSGGEGEFAVIVTGTDVLTHVVGSSETPHEGKWFGLQLVPEDVGDITVLEYKTSIHTENWSAFTSADVTEAGAEGEIVWWIDGDEDGPHSIWLKYADEDEETAIKLTVTFEPFEEEEPVDEEKPKIDTTSLVLEEGKLILTVEASDNIGLESLEVDHNLGKHSSTPEEVQLPEFRVPTESIGEVTLEIDEQTINAGSVDYVDGKWTITFNDDIVAVMKNLALEYQDGTIKFYLVVRDLAGNESGSMYDTTYEVVEYTWEEPAADEDTFILSYPSEATLPDGHPEPDGCEDATFVAGGDVNLEAGNWYFTAVTAKKNVEGAIANLQFQIDGVPNDAFDIHMYDFEGEKWYTNPPVWGSGFTAEDEPYNDGVTTYIFIEAKAEGNGSINIVLKDIVAEKTLSNTLVGAVRVTKAISDEE